MYKVWFFYQNHTHAKKSKSKSVTDAMNTTNTDFWKGKLYSKKAVLPVSQFCFFLLFSDILYKTTQKLIMKTNGMSLNTEEY